MSGVDSIATMASIPRVTFLPDASCLVPRRAIYSMASQPAHLVLPLKFQNGYGSRKFLVEHLAHVSTRP